MRIEDRDGHPQLMVRIAVVEGEERIRFEADGPFNIEDDCHSKKTKGQPRQIWEVRVKGGEAANYEYFVRTDLFDSEERARQSLKDRQDLGAPTCLLEAGHKLEHHGKPVLDNREYSVCLGPYASREEAHAARSKLELEETALVLRRMTGVPRGHVEVVDSGGMVLCLGRRVVVGAEDDGQIILHDSPVGRSFHWEHREKLSFQGTVEFLLGNDGQLLAINELPVEEYLVSVNSSEMDARCPVELLKAQTVAARATILATAGKHHHQEPFDLCNGDHCQCYYGVVREGPASRRAVEETRGEVLISGGRVCDARYSKVCGGIMEAYEYAWRGGPISYMRSGVDAPSPQAAEGFYPIDSESKARSWIEATPEAYCNADVPDLPDYLSYARKYYRWKVIYDREQLEGIIALKSGQKIGTLMDLKPLARGESGRISRLAVVGSEGTLVLESELEIRRVLSESHLYSSCFVIDYDKDPADRIEKIILRGAGWGHGVGLCQVGATMMAVRGIEYDRILAHYYQDSELKKIL